MHVRRIDALVVFIARGHAFNKDCASSIRLDFHFWVGGGTERSRKIQDGINAVHKSKYDAKFAIFMSP